ncbi:MAG: holo-ACP synthase [Armatimonadetes bacterium]|nr:holo-ACP synthase [Armatimonadota bacterium]
MIEAVGIDIVEVSRISEAMRDPRFVERILTQAERRPELTAMYVAGRWAVKEAVAKAVGPPLRWHDVEVLNDGAGRPFATVRASRLEPGSFRLHVSISHEKGHAVGMAVLESLDPRSPSLNTSLTLD